MKLIDYLTRCMKDDSVLDLLEAYDMQVIYKFDRVHENTPDSYVSAAHSGGFELGSAR